jgi:adenylate cyclase
VGDDAHAGPAAAELVAALLGGPAVLTAHELARRAGVSRSLVADLWRTLGLSRPDGDAPVFTERDAVAVERLVALVRDQGLALETVVSLVRAVGYNGDRVAMWQVEAVVEDLVDAGRDDRSARLELLARLPELVEPLEQLIVYAYRRQLAAVAARFTAEFGAAGSGDYGADTLPLARAVGFADMVSFTRLTAGFSPAELAAFVQGFEARVRDVVGEHGGRIVKTIGDGVLFVADDPVAGALVASHLAQAFSPGRRATRARPAAPRDVALRVSVVWGRLMSRFGDVFGAPVTLAARLCEVAEPGTVLVDQQTADVLHADRRFDLVPQPECELTGLGTVCPVRLALA